MPLSTLGRKFSLQYSLVTTTRTPAPNPFCSCQHANGVHTSIRLSSSRCFVGHGRCHRMGGTAWTNLVNCIGRRRPALYLHCTAHELTTESNPALFSHVGDLPGLNLWTGVNDETRDLYYKHDFKREPYFLSLIVFVARGLQTLRSRDGIRIDKVIVNKSLLASWLEHLTDMNWSENNLFTLINSNTPVVERIQTLLGPKDAHR
jgi:hypothetical protein